MAEKGFFEDVHGMLDPLGLDPFSGLWGKADGKEKKAAREKKNAEAKMKAEMEAAAKRISDQRPLDYAAKIDSLNQAAGMFEPANRMVGQIVGDEYMTNLKFKGDPTRMPGYVNPNQPPPPSPPPTPLPGIRPVTGGKGGVVGYSDSSGQPADQTGAPLPDMVPNQTGKGFVPATPPVRPPGSRQINPGKGAPYWVDASGNRLPG